MLTNIPSLLEKKTFPSFKCLDAKNKRTHHTCGENTTVNKNSGLKKHCHYFKACFYNLNLH